MNFMMIFFVVFMAYIVSDLIVKLVDQTRKSELYEKALNSEIIRLNEKIENLHNDMDILLKSQRESVADMEKIKEEAEARKKIVIHMASTVTHSENNLNDVMRQGNAVKEENQNLRREVDHLKLQQEMANIKMDAFSDYSKTNKDNLKDIENRFLFFKDELRDTLKEIQCLVDQVTKMDAEISSLGKDFKSLSDNLESFKKEINRMDHRAHHSNHVRERYSGSGSILKGIRKVLNYITGKLVDVFGGISSVLSLT